MLESKSSTNSLDVYSLKFNHCRNVYPIRLVKPCEKYKYDDQLQLRNVLNDLNNNDVVIDCASCDNPKRSNFKCVKCHSARFPCEYCEQPAVTLTEGNKNVIALIEKKYELQERNVSQEIEALLESQNEEDEESQEIENLRQILSDLQNEKKKELKKHSKTQLTWPSSTMKGKLRTLDGIRNIVQEIENDPDLVNTNPDFCKGIKGRSLFLDQPQFHMIIDIPVEYMHGMCIGVVKRTVSLTFNVGENRPRITKRKRTSPAMFNEKIKCIQFLREFSRRGRNLDFSVFKAAEYRNLVLFFFQLFWIA